MVLFPALLTPVFVTCSISIVLAVLESLGNRGSYPFLYLFGAVEELQTWSDLLGHAIKLKLTFMGNSNGCLSVRRCHLEAIGEI